MSEPAAAAPVAAAETPAPAATTGAKTSKLVLALLVLNLGGTGFGVFTAMTSHAEAAHAVVDTRPTTLEVTGPVVALEPFVVNLDEPGQSRYLKVTLELELATADVEAGITRSKQVIRDTILSHLSGLHLKDTLGATAKETLRVALMAKIEAVIGTGKVRRMFFQEFVVQ